MEIFGILKEYEVGDPGQRALCGLESSSRHWQIGGRDTTEHIQTHFESKRECSTADSKRNAREGEAPPSDSSSSILEDEPCGTDETPLCLIRDWQDSLVKRCTCVSHIIRSLSFVLGGDTEMCKHAGLLLILGKLLLLHYEHPERKQAALSSEREEPEWDQGLSISVEEWWWDCLQMLRGNTLVTPANISGQLDLSPFPESLCLLILDRLLHGAVCPSAEAQDPFPALNGAECSPLPSEPGLGNAQQTHWILFSQLPPAATWRSCTVPYCVSFTTERAQCAERWLWSYWPAWHRGTAWQRERLPCRRGALATCWASWRTAGCRTVPAEPGRPVHKKNSTCEPTSMEMMRRAAWALLALAKVDENHSQLTLHESQLLDISVSPAVDSSISQVICDVLFFIDRP
ncbi:AT-rich interactive domain-containing protein 1A-like [Gallus gallus]|uniref:AT-rich interactive domain-containing protein 1A-like n=1 Tax=Gallus gallus TaxID=9031 RepID=UPI001AE4BA21|nr:AT-rich interactive domain-containing protein 1A-like [Gallus gallus]